MTIVFTSSRLFNLLFNIVRCSKNEYTALLKINKELFQPHPRSLSKREGGQTLFFNSVVVIKHFNFHSFINFYYNVFK